MKDSSNLSFVYGTAWKEDRTEELTLLALRSGFRAIDTANQSKHYHEAGVGAALAKFAAEGGRREDLFLQTKFTHVRGQDHRLPYDPRAPHATQVAQSFASSLEHLGVSYLDSYVLHGLEGRHGLTEGDVTVWRAMEALHVQGKTRRLGVSNVALDQLEQLHALAEIKPAFVQNRCLARYGWDADVRAFCREHGVAYQGFSLLTGNRQELEKPAVAQIARRLGATVAQIVFRFAQRASMIPLTGTSSAAHMKEDLASGAFELVATELRTIERVGS